MRFVLKLAVLLIAAMPLAALGQSGSETVLRAEDGLTVQVNKHQATLPVPLWMGAGAPGVDVTAEVEIFRQIMPGGELVELMSVEEGMANWTHKTSALVMDADIFPSEAHIELLVAAFQQNCVQDKLRFQVLQPAVEGGEPVALLVCAQFNNGEQAGEVMAVTIVHAPEASGRIFVEWRGPAFDPDESATWPVPSVDDLRDTIARMSAGAALAPAG